MLLAAANFADLGIAIAGSVSAIVTVAITTRGQNKKLDKVEQSVATQNGKTSGEYIEDMWHRFERLEVGQIALTKQFAEHAVQDASHFATIEANLAHIADDSKVVRDRVTALEEQV